MDTVFLNELAEVSTDKIKANELSAQNDFLFKVFTP